jgi:hypothetical protein
MGPPEADHASIFFVAKKSNPANDELSLALLRNLSLLRYPIKTT